MEVYNWIVNAMVFALSPLSYVVYYQYKEIKKLKEKNKLLEAINKSLSDGRQ